jgi:sugar phosphate permease
MSQLSNRPLAAPALPTAAPTRVRWHIIGLLMAIAFISHVNRLSIRVAGDEVLRKQFAITKTEMGAVYSAFLFTYTLFMTPAGWLIDRRGAWAALVLMGLGLALFEAFTGLAGHVTSSPEIELAGRAFPSILISLVVIRAFMGVTAAPLHPGCGRMVSQWIPFPQRALANGLVIGAAGLGIATVSIVFGPLIDRFGWEKAFFILGGATALLVCAWTAYATNLPAQHGLVNDAERLVIQGGELPSNPTTGAESPNPATADWWVLLRNRSLVLLTLSYAAVGYFEYLFFYWMEDYIKEHIEPENSRLYGMFPPLAFAAAMPLGGWISDRCVARRGYRRGRAIVPIVGMLAGPALLCAGVLAEQPILGVVCLSLSLGAIGLTEGPFWSTAVELGGRRGGTAGGILNTGGNLGGMPAPYLTPLVAALFKGNWNVSLYLAGAVCLVGVLLWGWIDPNERVAEAT